MSESSSLHRKLAQVMYEADRIPKNGTAPAAMGGFKFVQVGDAADVIRKALAEQKVSMIPTAIELVSEADHATSSGKTMSTVTVRTTWTLTDADSGESIVIQSMGSGADMGDKAIPKAQTNAMKYALLMGFLLSTGDDPEMTDSSDRRGERNLRVGAADYQPPAEKPPPPPAHDGGLIGTAAVGKAPADFEIRERAEGGWAVAFRLTDGRKSMKVIAYDALAEALHAVKANVIDQRVQCWGVVSDETFTPKGTTKSITYQVLTLNRIETADFTLPSPDVAAMTVDASEELDALPLFSGEAA